jgi:hypothetical protein
MTADLEDYRAFLAREAAKKAVPAATSEVLQQAAVQAEYLTGSEYWDIFLRYLQSAVERSQSVEAHLLESLGSPTLVDHDAILKVKMQLLEVRARMEAWETAMGLPNLLMEYGETTKEIAVV